MDMNTKLWYRSPAKSFCEALPLGNGSLGAIVYSSVPQEQIYLNLDTFWSGNGNAKEQRVDRSILENAKKLCLCGEYAKAQELVEGQMLGAYTESYMPLGIIQITYPGIKEYKEYERELNLEKALLLSSFQSNGVSYKSEMFASYPDNILSVRLTCDIPGMLDTVICMSSRLQFFSAMDEGNSVVIYGNAPSHVVPNYVDSIYPVMYEKTNLGMPFCGYLTVAYTDGSLCIEDGKIHVKDASELCIRIAASDGYEGFGRPVNYSQAECFEKSKSILRKAERFSYGELKERHLLDYQRIFERVYLELDTEPERESFEEVPTDKRLAALKQGKEDNSLFCLYFHYNRYLMIACSREGSQPANLQGIWSDSTRPVWSSNWTININTQMNYWPVEVCNLTECFEPLLKMVEELSIKGQETARNYFGCRGWAANHNVDIWRHTEPVDGSARYAYWPMGGVWLSSQIYDYYKYTLDVDILRERIFPVMKSSAQFCLDWMVKREDGFYYTPLSTSPENTFYDGKGNECAVSYGSTSDMALIRELFKNVTEAADILGISDEVVNEILEISPLLAPYKTGKDGQLLEWCKEFTEVDSGHRHFSPLIAFHPGTTINKYDTPELIGGVKKFISRRLKSGGGHIGWSCAWLINFFARLGKGDEALRFLRQLLEKSSYDNLFDLHPPLGENAGEREVFQIDGNFGSASGVASMLLQSHLGEIELLPAVPSKWRDGKIKGLLAEGNVTVDIYWQDGTLTKALLKSAVDRTVTVRYGKKYWQLELKKGKNYVLEI